MGAWIFCCIKPYLLLFPAWDHLEFNTWDNWNWICDCYFERVVFKMKYSCEICRVGIDVDKRALKLCNNCFNEKCGDCGHKRAYHVDNNGSCIFEYSLSHKTKRGEYCHCKKFKRSEE